MPKYDLKTVLADGSSAAHRIRCEMRVVPDAWKKIDLVIEVDTDAGYAIQYVLDESKTSQTRRVMKTENGEFATQKITGEFRVVHTETGAINPHIFEVVSSTPV